MRKKQPSLIRYSLELIHKEAITVSDGCLLLPDGWLDAWCSLKKVTKEDQ